jgi:hypothetical protein
VEGVFIKVLFFSPSPVSDVRTSSNSAVLFRALCTAEGMEMIALSVNFVAIVFKAGVGGRGVDDRSSGRPKISPIGNLDLARALESGAAHPFSAPMRRPHNCKNRKEIVLFLFFLE